MTHRSTNFHHRISPRRFVFDSFPLPVMFINYSCTLYACICRPTLHESSSSICLIWSSVVETLTFDFVVDVTVHSVGLTQSGLIMAQYAAQCNTSMHPLNKQNIFPFIEKFCSFVTLFIWTIFRNKSRVLMLRSWRDCNSHVSTFFRDGCISGMIFKKSKTRLFLTHVPVRATNSNVYLFPEHLSFLLQIVEPSY